MIYFSVLVGTDISLYEAARIDGANTWQIMKTVADAIFDPYDCASSPDEYWKYISCRFWSVLLPAGSGKHNDSENDRSNRHIYLSRS